MRKDVFSIISSDHSRTKQMVRKLTGISIPQHTRAGLFAEFRSELTTNLKAEEVTIHRIVQQEEEFTLETLEAGEQHRILALLLQEAEQLPPNDMRWTAKLTVLRDLLEHHIEFEEDRIFEDARELLTARDIQELSEIYTKKKLRIADEVKSTIAVP